MLDLVRDELELALMSSEPDRRTEMADMWWPVLAVTVSDPASIVDAELLASGIAHEPGSSERLLRAFQLATDSEHQATAMSNLQRVLCRRQVLSLPDLVRMLESVPAQMVELCTLETLLGYIVNINPPTERSLSLLGRIRATYDPPMSAWLQKLADSNVILDQVLVSVRSVRSYADVPACLTELNGIGRALPTVQLARAPTVYKELRSCPAAAVCARAMARSDRATAEMLTECWRKGLPQRAAHLRPPPGDSLWRWTGPAPLRCDVPFLLHFKVSISRWAQDRRHGGCRRSRNC